MRHGATGGGARTGAGRVSAEDLLLRPAFMQACAEALANLAAELADCDGLHVVVGHPHQFGEPRRC
jgi:hypothetical protein